MVDKEMEKRGIAPVLTTYHVLLTTFSYFWGDITSNVEGGANCGHCRGDLRKMP
jgi:hypothetical protein